jgi:hypothetical protein
VCDDYEPPFPCTATLRTLTLESGVVPRRDANREITTALRHE